MRKTHLYLLCGIALISGCRGEGDSVEKANLLMRSHVASDVEINIEPNSEKVFLGGGADAAVCGRAHVKQGVSFDRVQRFVILANKDFSSGFARFDASDARKEDSEFVVIWNKRCDGYVLPQPPEALRASTPEAKKRRNFDGSLSHFSKGQFALDDVWQITDLLKNLSRDKGEFEKKKEYEKRMSELANSVLYEDVKLSGSFAFAVDRLEGGLAYNPDTETLKFEALNFSNGVEIATRNVDSFSQEMFSGVSAKSWYDYYKNKEFKEVSFKESVSVAPIKSGGTDLTKFVARVKLSPARAEAIKGHVSVVIVGKIVPPFLQFSTDLPHRYDDRSVTLHRIIPLKLDGIWLVDDSTGEVLSKKYKIEPL